MATRKLVFPRNIVRDYNVVQGTHHVTDLSKRPPSDIHVRHISVENSSATSSIAVAITEDHQETFPPVAIVLRPGEVRSVAVNTMGEPMQFIHMTTTDAESRQYVGAPFALRTDANQFVLRHGINKWFVQTFKTPSYRASF